MEKFLLALYVIVAIAMIGFILMQRGPGAQAGSGFGSGASGTVFGARGSANFLSISTKWLAIAFFVISIAMGAYISRVRQGDGTANLGVMAVEAAAAEAASKPAADANPADAKPADASIPEATAPATDASVPAAAPAPVAPVEDSVPAAPADAGEEVEKKDSESSQS